MSETAGTVRTVGLGEVTPARSRHAGRRSAVALTADTVLVGKADGSIRAYDRTDARERWRSTTGTAAVVAAEPFGNGVVVGERGPAGEVRCHDAVTGAVWWRQRTADDIGEPTTETRFQLPFVASIAATDGRCYVAARRYERDDDRRTFESVVYALAPDGTVAWTYRADASPISLDADDERVAVAYNRCPGSHQHGLVVLDADDGTSRWHWDPGTEGDRRVGGVSLLGDGVAVASHGDYRGYRLGAGGAERWAVDLATPERVGDEQLYAYPNHVSVTDAGVVFVTGNTYPTEGREAAGRHSNEHTALGYTPDGDRRWRTPVGGFASEVAGDGERVLVPGAQNFREREPVDHGLWTVGARNGREDRVPTAGVLTAVAATRGSVAAVEEPVAYHDGDGTLGAYRLHLF